MTITFRLPISQVDPAKALVDDHTCESAIIGAGTMHPVGVAEFEDCSEALKAALLELGAVDQTDGIALGTLVGRELASTAGLNQNQISTAYRTGLAIASFQAGLVAGDAGLENADLQGYMAAFQNALYGGLVT